MSNLEQWSRLIFVATRRRALRPCGRAPPMMPTMCNMPDLSDLQARSPHGAFVIHQFIGAGNGLPRRGSTIVVAHGRRIAQPLRSLTDGRFYVRLDDD